MCEVRGRTFLEEILSEVMSTPPIPTTRVNIRQGQLRTSTHLISSPHNFRSHPLPKKKATRRSVFLAIVYAGESAWSPGGYITPVVTTCMNQDNAQRSAISIDGCVHHPVTVTSDLKQCLTSTFVILAPTAAAMSLRVLIDALSSQDCTPVALPSSAYPSMYMHSPFPSFSLQFICQDGRYGGVNMGVFRAMKTCRE